MKARITIDWLEPLPDGTPVPQAVFEFDTVRIDQQRPVHSEFAADGQVTKLVPDRTTSTQIYGSRTVSAEDVEAEVAAQLARRPIAPDC